MKYLIITLLAITLSACVKKEERPQATPLAEETVDSKEVKIAPYTTIRTVLMENPRVVCYVLDGDGYGGISCVKDAQ